MSTNFGPFLGASLPSSSFPRQACRLRVLALALLALVAITGCASPRVADAAPVRIMPLGDSITDGFNIPGGYRIELEEALVADGYEFDFVGSLANGPATLADRQHEGHSGLRIDEVAALIDGALARHRPEVVLLMIGTNDVLQSHGLTQAPQRLSNLIDRITTQAPSTTLLVSSLTPLGGSTRDEQVRRYNAAIPAIVRDKSARGRRVGFVDMYPALTTADLADGVHPNATGYRKMAAVWRGALPPTPAAVEGAEPVSSAPTPAVPPRPAIPAVPVPVAQPEVPLTSASPLVRVAQRRLHADRRGRVRVRVSCDAAAHSACSGYLRLRALRGRLDQRRLATRRFDIRLGETRAVALRLDRRELRRLRRRAWTRVSVEAVVRSSDGGQRYVARITSRLTVG